MNKITFSLNHLILFSGLLLMIVPVWVIFASSTHTSLFINTNGLQFILGDSFIENYSRVLFKTSGFFQEITAFKMLHNKVKLTFINAKECTLFGLKYDRKQEEKIFRT